MITKIVKELNVEDFSKYGRYIDFTNPKGVKFGNDKVEFYRDMIQLDLGISTTASFSLCRLYKRDYIVDASEYHNYSGEMILPLDGDILIHVGSATDNEKVPVDQIEIYRIPKGTIVCINPGVWHQAAFPYNCESVNVLVTLPERTYMKDCYLIPLSPEEQICI